MPTHSPIRKPSRRRPSKERRAPPGTAGSLRWLKGLLERPIGFERREGRLHLVLVERRRARPGGSAPVESLRDDLRTHLLTHSEGRRSTPLAELALVHDALGRRGWPDVDALPAAVLAAAVAQAEALLRQSPSRALAIIVDRLRILRVGAELREQRQNPGRETDFQDSVLVSEATAEEFEAVERHWQDTVSPPTPTGDAD